MVEKSTVKKIGHRLHLTSGGNELSSWELLEPRDGLVYSHLVKMWLIEQFIPAQNFFNSNMITTSLVVSGPLSVVLDPFAILKWPNT